VAKGSPRRPQFLERSGKIQIPFIVDPNSGVEMFESDDIVRYLEETYGVSDSEGVGR
jgi:glutathione S-transferase